MSKIEKNQLTTIILAGGKSSRMGGNDKGLLEINGKYIISYLNKLSLKFSKNVLINANRNIEKYESMGLKTCSDILPDYQGPLSGMLTGLTLADTEYVITLPCDGPFVTEDFFKKMMDMEESDDINVASDGDRVQPVYALIRKNMINNLNNFLKTGQRKIDKWYANCHVKEIDFSDNKEIFVNINDKEEIEAHKNNIIKKIELYEN